MPLQVLALGQEVAFEYQGQQFVLTVKSLMVLDRKNTQMSVTRGQLVKITSFVYEAPKQTNIKVYATVNSPQPSCCMANLGSEGHC